MKEMRDIVVLLPGILGSVLKKDDRDVWGVSGGAVARAVWNLGSNIQALATFGVDGDDSDYQDGVSATRLFADAHIIPWFWKIDGYTLIANTLKSEFDLRDGENYFEFPYDWRLDNRIAARNLQRQSHVWLKTWREKTGNNDAKLILIGHSMGGLVARYFLEVLEGWKSTRKLITFGTPYAGSLKALAAISNGLSKKLGFIELIDLSEMVRSLTSVYQLLPQFKCIETDDGYRRINDPAIRIPNLDRSRVAAAFAFHEEIKKAVEDNRKTDEYLRNGYTIHPFAGIYQPTFQSARVNEESIDVLQEIGGEDTDGDGTVPSISALPYEWSESQRDSAFYAAEQHASLQNFSAALVQVCRLLSNQNMKLDVYKAFLSRIGLDIDDVFHTGEPVTVKARSEGGNTLSATIRNTVTGEIVRQGELQSSASKWQNRIFAPLEGGSYRLTIAEKTNFKNDGTAEPVNTIFLILKE